ncbi:MAG: EAL domain-containing protein, partial [Gammaproteobacteria bacterium]
GSFVRDMPQSQLSRAIVASIVNIAAVTGAATVAEHVESDEIRTLLLELGVDYVQGFAIHRPEPLANVLGNMGQEFVTVVEPDDMIDLGDYTQPLKGRG